MRGLWRGVTWASFGLLMSFLGEGVKHFGIGRGVIRPLSREANGSKIAQMLYTCKIKLLGTRWGASCWRRWRTWRGDNVGSAADLPEQIRALAAGRSFLEVGCAGALSEEAVFIAEGAGATAVKVVHTHEPTAEFERQRRKCKSNVEYIVGQITHPLTIARVGPMDVVLCAGGLHRAGDPMEVLSALRRMCQDILILRTSVIPEVPGLRSVAVGGATRMASGCDTADSDWCWGLTPSFVRSMLTAAGFYVEKAFVEPFAQTLICSAVEVPSRYVLADRTDAPRLLSEEPARELLPA